VKQCVIRKLPYILGIHYIGILADQYGPDLLGVAAVGIREGWRPSA